MKTLELVLSVLVCAIALLVCATALMAQPTPEGLEFQVNPFDDGYQLAPAVSSAANGRFVVVWRNSANAGPGADGSGSSVWGQLFDSEGTRQGFSFLVNSFTTGPQAAPAVAMGADGDFVIVWQSGDMTYPGPDGSFSSIQGRRYDSSGTALGTEFQVNTYATGYQTSPTVGMFDDGGFVVLWEAASFPFSSVVGRSFASNGVPLGGEFGAGVGSHPDVAVSPGQFVVAWFDGFVDPVETHAQRFTSTGVLEGSVIDVNASADGGYPSIATDAAGDFVVVWESRDASSIGVWGRRFDSGGAPQSGELDLDLASAGAEPDVARDDDGNFAVVWHESDGSGLGIMGRSVAASGFATSPPFLVNSYTTDQQWFASVASDADADLVVVWTGIDTQSFGIKGQRFEADLAFSPLIFTDGFESGDTTLWSSTVP